MFMLKNQFVIISIKNSSSLSKLTLNNSNSSIIDSEITVNLGKPVVASFIDEDVFLLKSDNVEIRIDINMDSIEKAIKNFKSEKYV